MRDPTRRQTERLRTSHRRSTNNTHREAQGVPGPARDRRRGWPARGRGRRRADPPALAEWLGLEVVLPGIDRPRGTGRAR
jgi:hypothetical protein